MSYKPDTPGNYQGKQVIINSDRLLFNAKKDSILLFSDKAIGFSTNGSFHFDTSRGEGNKFVVNAPKIYLGLTSDGDLATEPVLLGDKTGDLLTSILKMVDDLITDIVVKFTFPGGVSSPGNEGMVATRRAKIKSLIKKIKDVKSKNVRTI